MERRLQRNIIVLLCGLALAADGVRSVLLVRHCVHSTKNMVKYVLDQVTPKKYFTSFPIASYHVPDKSCTEQGVKIMQGFGRHLPDFVSGNFDRLQIVSDAMQRGVDTGTALLHGLKQSLGEALDGKSCVGDADLFDTLEGEKHRCQFGHTEAEVSEQVKRRMSSIPMPWDLKKAKEELQKIIGVGEVGPLVDMAHPNVTSTGAVTGSVVVMKDFAEDLLYTYASNISYLAASVEQRYRFISWYDWYRSVARANALVAVQNVALVRAILAGLSGEAGVSIFVGRSEHMDGVNLFLNMSWKAPPYDKNLGDELLPIPPGSAFLFEYDSDLDIVNASFLYHTYEVARGDQLGRPHKSLVFTGLSLADFRRGVSTALEQFPEAVACWKLLNKTSSAVHVEPVTVPILAFVLVFVLSCFVILGVWGWWECKNPSEEKEAPFWPRAGTMELSFELNSDQQL